MSSQPYTADIVGVIDESAQIAGSGVYYVVSTALMLDPHAAVADLDALQQGRTNPFHWTKEGIEKRHALCDIIIEHASAAISIVQSTGRKKQTAARDILLRGVARWAHLEGAGQIIIESGDDRTDSRDRATLRALDRELPTGLAFTYDHRTKTEPLLALADAVAGATSEYLVSKGDVFYNRLVDADVLHLEYAPT